MRLLDTQALKLEEVYNTSLPPYAILSHRWDPLANELTLQDVQKNRKRHTSGFRKMQKFCKLARDNGIRWGWIDTCCIDKTSSAELTESINSMWSYYKQAEICYAFLADVETVAELEKSQWWRRGWTLQELLAPSKVLFYNKRWQYLGNKHELATRIRRITKIPQTVLRDGESMRLWSVAQKMSWAAGRLTTRPEDRAYSLLGIFRVNMPLLYGEGNKAFQRLQIEILQKYPDESVFAWHTSKAELHHVLAATPDSFAACSNISIQNGTYRRHIDLYPRRESPPRVTSWGIEMRANARKLIPKCTMVVDRTPQTFLWALTLTTSCEDRMRELPCTLVLVRSGPAPYSYRRYRAIHRETKNMLKQLREQFVVEAMEENRLFYLSFDQDLLY